MGARVNRLQHEAALRSDHAHPVADRQAPERGREADHRHVADVELVALRAGRARRRRNRVGTLHELVVGEDADGHVLARLEVRGLAVELHPEVRQVVGLVLAPDERRVVLRRVGRDDSLIDDVHDLWVLRLGHVHRMVPSAGRDRPQTSGRDGPARTVSSPWFDVLRPSRRVQSATDKVNPVRGSVQPSHPTCTDP